MGRRDSGHLAGSLSATVVGHRTGLKSYVRWVEAVVKPGEDGACVHQHLNFILFGKVVSPVAITRFWGQKTTTSLAVWAWP